MIDSCGYYNGIACIHRFREHLWLDCQTSRAGRRKGKAGISGPQSGPCGDRTEHGRRNSIDKSHLPLVPLFSTLTHPSTYHAATSFDDRHAHLSIKTNAQADCGPSNILPRPQPDHATLSSRPRADYLFHLRPDVQHR